MALWRYSFAARFLPVSPLGQSGYLLVGLYEGRDLAADGHVVGLGIEGQVGAEDLGIVGLVHLQPARRFLVAMFTRFAHSK
jgi:hypothetical protein